MAILTGGCRADTAPHILQLQQSCPPPNPPGAIHGGTWSGIWSSQFYGHSTTPTVWPAEIPARPMSCCCHLSPQNQQALPSHPLQQVGALPQPALQQGGKPKHRDMELTCLWQHELFFSCVCVAGADLFAHLLSSN